MQNISMPRPERLDSGNMVNDNRRIEAPRHYENGETVRERSVNVPPVRHAEIAGNNDILHAISREQGAERVHKRYYWHTLGDKRYAHFYDADGIDWYGFYFGPSFYWTRYYGNRWWWYDQGYARWVFWANGYWWWQGPGGAAFVYMDNNYYPYQEGSVTVQRSTTVAPAQTDPVPSGGKQWNSPDLSRMVQVTGPENEAFIYDKTGGKPVYLAFLGKEVDKVRFSGGVAGQPLQVLVDFKDGAYAIFDGDGKSAQPQAAVSVPPIPDAPPAAAPGQ
ncbi:MAG: hypothetical protein NTY45_04230 [Elusimicrobia bacterium]|nr:hypothetical protein [Elusimicrobiota bacterium]